MHRVLLILVLLTISARLGADQSDPELDGLFDQLKVATSSADGLRLTREIWFRWLDAEDSGTAELVRDGVLLMNTGDYARALALFTRVTELAPDFAEGWNKRATVLYMMDRNAESIDDIRRTLALEPRHFGALSGLGLIQLEFGNYAAALTAFSKAHEINPHMPGVEENIRRARELVRKNAI